MPGTAAVPGVSRQVTVTVAELAAEVVAALGARGLTVGSAESLTGGLVGAALTSVAGSSAVYRGGIVAYATDLKHSLLDVDAGELGRDGAVAATTAAAMAAGVRARTGAHVGVATTGVAGPTSQEGHAPGTVYVALADRAGVVVRELALPGDRDAVRAATVVAVLALVLERLTPPGDDTTVAGR